MQEVNTSSNRSVRVLLLLLSATILIVSGVAFWSSESGVVLEVPEVSAKNLAQEWQLLAENEAKDSLFRSKMVESFHKVALACGKDEDCLNKARASLQSTFNRLQKATVIPKKPVEKSQLQLFQKIKALDREWELDANRFSRQIASKVIVLHDVSKIAVANSMIMFTIYRNGQIWFHTSEKRWLAIEMEILYRV